MAFKLEWEEKKCIHRQHVLYVDKPMESMKKLLELLSEFQQDYKIKDQYTKKSNFTSIY